MDEGKEKGAVMSFPGDVQYTETHEWMRREADGVRVGLTDYAQRELTDIVFVDLPELNRHVEAGEEITSLESVKAVGYVYAPLTGTIAAVNEKLSKQPELVNQDPYGEGWIVCLRPDDPEEVVDLLDAVGYRRKTEAPADEEES